METETRFRVPSLVSCAYLCRHECRLEGGVGGVFGKQMRSSESHVCTHVGRLGSELSLESRKPRHLRTQGSCDSL